MALLPLVASAAISLGVAVGRERFGDSRDRKAREGKLAFWRYLAPGPVLP